MNGNAPETDAKNSCPCGLGASYEACCKTFHTGVSAAPSAERLMRSRYSAFAVADAAYLLATWHPSTRPASMQLDAGLTWKRLIVESSTGVATGESAATVTFTAIARDAEGRHIQREKSRFLREQGIWFYVGGDALDV